MVSISLLNPMDQPTGRDRLLNHLMGCLTDKQFEKFRFVVAFAKVGPLLRMKTVIDASRATGMKIEAVFGLDHQGTSAQALQFALTHFDAVYVVQEPNHTFHPKMYAFEGPQAARLYVGSNNLTVGGTETNFESSVRLDLTLPNDAAVLKEFTDCWDELLPPTCPATTQLTPAILNKLILNQSVPDETVMRKTAQVALKASPAPRPPRSGLKTKPASALPPKKVAKGTAGRSASVKSTKPSPTPSQPTPTPVVDPTAAQGLAIQIKPHHNGEIFLSVTAALQNPDFFGWPFNGQTTPKKGSNVGYPQLSPDPRVDITVYGAALSPILQLQNYALNTVYYETKSEIRVTASPLVPVVPEYSVMIIRKSDALTSDYDIVIHTPDSPDYAGWVAACNQSMPGGGKAPRKFGWF